jgi:hypothetical protein
MSTLTALARALAVEREVAQPICLARHVYLSPGPLVLIPLGMGREFDITIMLHPLSGRRDATAFHLEAGRLRDLASRHRHACVATLQPHKVPAP